MPSPTPETTASFADRTALRDWFVQNAASRTELWVHIHKVGRGIPSVTWEDCVIVALSFGWIDSISKSLGADAWVQRLTPRRRKSPWSKRNRDHVERLIGSGQMTDAGLAEVIAAQADGRWDAAYAGPAQMQIPADFIVALQGYPDAATLFETLNKQNLFAIYFRLHTAKTPETRARRMAKLIAALDAGETFH